MGFALMKVHCMIEIPNTKYQTNPNDRISNIQTWFRPKKFWSLNIRTWDLIGIWCLEFVILFLKLQGWAIYISPAPKNQGFTTELEHTA